jgi:WD40 repeat protein
MNTDPKSLAEQYTPTKPKDSKPFESDKKQHNGARYSPCGRFLIAGGYDGSVHRWDVTGDEPKLLEPLTGHHGWVQALAFAPGGGIVFTGDSWGRLRAWDYTADKPTPSWEIAEAHDGWLRRIAVSGDGKMLATCGHDQVVRLWDAATGKKEHEFTGHGHDVFVVAFHPDNRQLVSGDHYGVIKHWDIADRKHVRDFDARVLFVENRLQEVGSVRSILFDKDGTTLLAGGTKPKNGGNVQGTPTLLTFNWADGQKTAETTFGGEGDVYVYELQLDPRGYVLVGISGNPGTGKFCFWRIGDKEPFFSQAMGNCHAISVHPSGQKLAMTGINANNQGNGRVKGTGDMDYPGNYSPITFWDMPVAS